jgi:peptidoglycan hydrolase-like protein with peptidoglycan-binding domain
VTTSTNPGDHAVYTRRRLLVASAAVALPTALFAVLRNESSKPADSATTPPSDAPAIGSTAPAPSSTSAATTTSVVPFDHAIGSGSVNSKVAALQDRLRVLAFDPGPTDGIFGPATEQAVWAYEKFFEHVPPAEVSGVVTPERWQHMNAAFDVKPRRGNPGTHVEVLLPSQVAVVYRDNRPVLISHVSSGTGDEWCAVVKVDEDDGTQTEQAICGVAVTPGGVYRFNRRIAGWRESKLGRLYNPVYFNYGIAIHGATSVPNRPASRGCVRIPMHIAEYFPSLVADGDLVYVFDGVEQPETYGAQLPVFDYPDPNATTSTTSSTTTTTTLPATTHPHESATTAAISTTSTTVPAG